MSARRPRIDRSVRDAAQGLILFGTRGVMAFVSGVVIAHVLHGTGQGQVTLVVTTSGLLSLGVQILLAPELVATRLDGAASAAQLHAQGLALGLARAVPLGLVAAAALRVGHAPWAIAGAEAVLTPLLAASTVAIYVEQGLGGGRRASALGAGAAVAACGTALAIAAAGRLSVGLAVVAFSANGLIPTVGILARRRPHRPIPHHAGTLRGDRARNALSAIAVLLLWRSDTYVVAALLSTRELGVYSVGVSLAEVGQVAASGLRAALIPRLERLDRPDAPLRLLARLHQASIGLLLLLGLPMLLAGRTIIGTVYGHDFVPAATVTLALLPGMWGFIVVQNLVESLQISGDGAYLLRALLAGLAVNVAVNVAGTRAGGLLVPALSSSLAYSLVAALLLRRAAARAAVPTRHLLWPTKVAIADPHP